MGAVLEKIKIRHDNTGAAPGWHLDHIEIRCKSKPGPLNVFECKRWLAVNEEDKQICRILFSGAAREAGSAAKRYYVTVFTGGTRPLCLGSLCWWMPV